MKKYKFNLYAVSVKEYIIKAENKDDAEAIAIADFKNKYYAGISVNESYAYNFKEV